MSSVIPCKLTLRTSQTSSYGSLRGRSNPPARGAARFDIASSTPHPLGRIGRSPKIDKLALQPVSPVGWEYPDVVRRSKQ